MIYDKVKNLRLYTALDKGFAAVADFVEANDLEALAPGRYDLPGGAFANVSVYEPKAGDMPEAHRNYADLQLMVSGSEDIEVVPLSFCSGSTGYKPDIEFYGSYSDASRITLAKDTFAYLAPQDAHRPCIFNGSKEVKKIVFKLPVE